MLLELCYIYGPISIAKVANMGQLYDFLLICCLRVSVVVYQLVTANIVLLVICILVDESPSS